MLTLTCKRAAALLSASMDRALTLRERLPLRLHLRVCAACPRFRRGRRVSKPCRPPDRRLGSLSPLYRMTSDAIREWRESALYWEKHGPTIRVMFAPLTRALIEEA